MKETWRKVKRVAIVGAGPFGGAEPLSRKEFYDTPIAWLRDKVFDANGVLRRLIGRGSLNAPETMSMHHKELQV